MVVPTVVNGRCVAVMMRTELTAYFFEKNDLLLWEKWLFTPWGWTTVYSFETNACVLGMPRLLHIVTAWMVSLWLMGKQSTSGGGASDYECSDCWLVTQLCKRAVSELQCCSGSYSRCEAHRLCWDTQKGRFWLQWEVPTHTMTILISNT